MLTLSGPLSAFFFLFFFAISTAAFRWGYDEGARVTLACAALYALAAIRAPDATVLARVMLRTAYLIGLGYMVSHWANLLLTHRRQIGLLRDVSRLSNPRFGVDHTIASVLEHARDYFKASSCLIVTRDRQANGWLLRSAGSNAGAFNCGQCVLDDAAAAPLLSLPAGISALFCAPALERLPWPGKFLTCENGSDDWQRGPAQEGRRLADLLGGRSFICVPIPLRGEDGRMFVVAPGATLGRADARFLAQVAAQAFPVIENIELLDRMASDAARREREKFSNDLHDTTLQPYIGLSHALQGLLDKVRADDPIAGELRQVADMADNFIRDLRHFRGTISHKASAAGEPAFLLALRAHAAQVKDYFNLDITVGEHERLGINDRLGAEVFQLVSEGMSNIRRHTLAARGSVSMRRSMGWLHIRIENEGSGTRPAPFVPRSISERAASLGGYAYVASGDDGATAVNIDIPV
ncbi:GAF domain-containing sensor histidine kinase [Massilia soli]|uniref:GAF domain-containing sensor histidine kinase n=1 Tax=Massilia soli TaxID=2792854 RepID=UPI001CBF928B|nr:histidine kinase [Massilia soli]